MTGRVTESNPRGLPFGGKGAVGREWKPLPYMQEWLDNLKAEEKSTSYVGNAKLSLSHFATFAAREGIELPDDITRAALVRYQQYLLELRSTGRATPGEPFSVAYRQRLLKDLRSWIYWMLQVSYLEVNPWVRIKVGETAKKPKPLEEEEVAALFAAHRQQAFTIDPFSFHRREVILTLLYAWGLRIHELQAINLANVDMRLDWVITRNKGGGTKPLPFGDAIKQVVQRWLAHRAKYAKIGEDALLVDQNGNRLSLQMIRKIVTECGARAGISVNPHRLRDTFGTTMLDNDVEVERIMKMMGHTQRSQTLAYARVNDHKVKESHDRVMNPMIERLLGA